MPRIFSSDADIELLHDALEAFVRWRDGAAVGTIISAIAGYMLYESYRKRRQARRVDAAPEVTSAGLRQLLTTSSSGSSPSPSPSASTDVEAESTESQLVCVRGSVSIKPPGSSTVLGRWQGHPVEPFTSVGHSLTKGAVQQLTVKSIYREFKTFGERKELLERHRKSVPFGLQDSTGFIALDETSRFIPLQQTHETYNFLERNPAGDVLRYALGQRILLGTVRTEHMLKLDTWLTALGVPQLTAEGFVMLRPDDALRLYLTPETKHELGRRLASESRTWFYCGLFFACLGGGILSYAVGKFIWRKYFFARHQLRSRGLEPRHDEDEEEQEEEEVGPDDSVPASALCVICLTRRRRVCFNPCGHNVCCMACARALFQQDEAGVVSTPLCPICRRLVVSVIRVYSS